MKYCDIKNVDTANGPGCRVSLWVSGCSIKCPGCHNKEAQDFEYGHEFTDETEDYIIKLLEKPYIKGLSVLGGEPLDQDERLLALLRKVKVIYSDKDIWLYTGYLFTGEFEGPLNPLFELVDVLVDGPFVEDKKQLGLLFRGSTNQRLIDMKASIKAKDIVLFGE